jgi:very-short-patch-repair endonuclease
VSGNAAKNSRLANEKQCKSKEPTLPEKILYAELDYLGVDYLKQHRIFHWTVDAYIPKTKTIIQADGDYWHGNPEFQQNRPLDKRQTKRMGTDKSQNIWFEKSGYTVYRIWQSELQKWETR